MTTLKELAIEQKFANKINHNVMEDGHIGLTPCMVVNNKKLPLETIWMTTEVFMALKDIFVDLAAQIKNRIITQ